MSYIFLNRFNFLLILSLLDFLNLRTTLPVSVRKAESRKREEDKIKWHTQRGDSLINYTEFGDLASIMNNNIDYFADHIVSIEWARNIITTIERSRNVIMHSGELSARDIEQIGINIRDWISQVGG